MLQKMLADQPDLLAGDQTSGEARWWLLVSQEVSLASDDSASGGWYVDHLFIDQGAVRTLVEVTGSSDTRIRREVVAQTLDYAANAVVYRNVEKLRSVFELRRAGRGVSPEDALHDHVGDEAQSRERAALAGRPVASKRPQA